MIQYLVFLCDGRYFKNDSKAHQYNGLHAYKMGCYVPKCPNPDPEDPEDWFEVTQDMTSGNLSRTVTGTVIADSKLQALFQSANSLTSYIHEYLANNDAIVIKRERYGGVWRIYIANMKWIMDTVSYTHLTLPTTERV